MPNTLTISINMITIEAIRQPISADLKAFDEFVNENFSAEGELLQLQKAQSGDTVEDDYLRIIYSKTASRDQGEVR